jgi:hypothetical protein
MDGRLHSGRAAPAALMMRRWSRLLHLRAGGLDHRRQALLVGGAMGMAFGGLAIAGVIVIVTLLRRQKAKRV